MKEQIEQAIELLREIKNDVKELKDQINKESQLLKIDYERKNLIR